MSSALAAGNRNRVAKNNTSFLLSHLSAPFAFHLKTKDRTASDDQRPEKRRESRKPKQWKMKEDKDYLKDIREIRIIAATLRLKVG